MHKFQYLIFPKIKFHVCSRMNLLRPRFALLWFLTLVAIPDQSSQEPLTVVTAANGLLTGTKVFFKYFIIKYLCHISGADAMCKAMDHVEKYQNGEDTDYHGLASDAWDIGKGLLWSRLDLLNKLF